MGPANAHARPRRSSAQSASTAATSVSAGASWPLSQVVQRVTSDPRSLAPADVAQLQRTIGNAALGRLVAGAAPPPNRTGLPDELKSGVESLSGFAMDDVRVHYNSPQPAQLQAHAYAQGSNIHIGPGQERNLPHEAWHVVQQKQGRVKPTLQMKDVAINDDQNLENESDVMGKTALRESQFAADGETTPGSRAGPGVMQFVWVDTNDPRFRWHELLGGLQWYFDPDTENFHYDIIDDLAVPVAIWSQIEAYEGQPLTERELDQLGFQEIAADARVEDQTDKVEPAAGMVTNTVAQAIAENVKNGVLPFKPELGLGGCSWFIWKGHGQPYTAVDKRKPEDEPKDVAIDATVRLPLHSLVIDTKFLADRHAMYMGDPEFMAETERRWRAHAARRSNKKVGGTLNRKNKQALEFYQRGLAEHEMWVSIGRMVASHPAGVGVVVLQGSDFSKSGDGKFLVVADPSRISVIRMNSKTEEST